MHYEESLRQFEARCRELGLAVTHQRTLIYRELMSMGEHPTPELVYERVRQHIPAISLGTVYKNIRTFLDAGLLREVSFHHGTQRLETNVEPHHHLVCTRCRKILDIPESELEPVRLKKKLKTGFKVERFSIELLGICGDCAQLSQEN